jgi:hypothetical protein
MNARIVLVLLTFAFTVDAHAAESSKYLNAVRTFADNVLKYGRDTVPRILRPGLTCKMQI